MMMFMMIMMRAMRMRMRVEVEVGWRLEARSVRSGQGGQRAGGLPTDGLGQDHHRGAAHYHLQKDPDRSPWWPASLSCPNRHHYLSQSGPCPSSSSPRVSDWWSRVIYLMGGFTTCPSSSSSLGQSRPTAGSWAQDTDQAGIQLQIYN